MKTSARFCGDKTPFHYELMYVISKVSFMLMQANSYYSGSNYPGDGREMLLYVLLLFLHSTQTLLLGSKVIVIWKHSSPEEDLCLIPPIYYSLCPII